MICYHWVYPVLFLTFVTHETHGIKTSINAPLDSNAHLHSRRVDDATEWSIASVEDLNILHYDRSRGRVLGFDSRTGKVFVQDNKLVAAHRHPHAAVQILQYKGHGEYNLLAHESLHNELVLRPRQVSTSVAIDQTVLWVVDFAADLVILVHPHTNEKMKCKCHLRNPRGAMAHTPLYLGAHCRPVLDTEKHVYSAGFVIGGHVKPSASARQSAFCMDLSQTLRTMKFIAFVQSSVLNGSKLDLRLDTLRPTEMVPRHMMNGVSKEGRAHMAQRIKFVVKLVYATQRVVAALWTYVTSIIKFSNEYVVELKRAPKDNQQGLMQFPMRVQQTSALYNKTNALFDEPFACNASVSSVLRFFLAYPKTFLTPDSTNMTLVSRSLGAYAQQKATCLKAAMDKIESMLKCVLRHPKGVSVNPENLGALNSLMGTGYLISAMKKGVPASEIGDQIVKASESITLEVLSRSKQLAMMANTMSTPGINNQNIVFLEDIWCCATEGHTPIVNRSAPLCIPKEKRVIIDTMTEMNLTLS